MWGAKGYLFGGGRINHGPGFSNTVGRESALRNEEVVACVVADTDLRESDLLEFCRSGLSAWQAPKRIFVVDAIPVNERGKVSRRELAKQFAL